MTDATYDVQGLPLDPIKAGSTVLVAGPPHLAAQDVGYRLLRGAEADGRIIITTNQRATRVATDCQAAGVELSPERSAIIDCVGDTTAGVPASVFRVSGPVDLTGIFMRYADAISRFSADGVTRVRTSVTTLSTILSFADLRPVSRFVHALVGRIDNTDGLGFLHVDPDMHDERAISTISQFCTGRIDVRETADGQELRARGLPTQPRDWTAFETRT